MPTGKLLIGCVLLGKALGEGNRWYFYSRKIEARVTDNGYWKPLGRDEPVVSAATSDVVGMKKYFVFHVGEVGAATGAAKTNWIMHEFRLCDGASSSTAAARSSKRRGRPKRVCILYFLVSINIFIRP